MSATAPSSAELMRRLDDVVTRLDRLTITLEERYVRIDVQQANDAAVGIQLKGFEDELHVMAKRADATDAKIETLSALRNNERDERDKQRSSDRRLILSVAFASLAGPLLYAWLSHVLGLH